MRLFVLLILNFGALALGSLLMGGNPAENEWYQNLNQAPWTPPGWVFGLAWTTIMICYSIYLYSVTKDYSITGNKSVLLLFIFQWVLNVGWNPIFFKWHLVWLGAIVIVLLIIVLVAFHMNYSKKNPLQIWTLFPYLSWLIIALSLNLYIAAFN